VPAGLIRSVRCDCAFAQRSSRQLAGDPSEMASNCRHTHRRAPGYEGVSTPSNYAASGRA
jgi:hypothetical protein